MTRSRLLTSLDATRLKPSGQLPDGRLTCAVASADVRLGPRSLPINPRLPPKRGAPKNLFC
jgi:hypothetical protein